MQEEQRRPRAAHHAVDRNLGIAGADVESAEAVEHWLRECLRRPLDQRNAVGATVEPVTGALVSPSVRAKAIPRM